MRLLDHRAVQSGAGKGGLCPRIPHQIRQARNLFGGIFFFLGGRRALPPMPIWEARSAGASRMRPGGRWRLLTTPGYFQSHTAVFLQCVSCGGGAKANRPACLHSEGRPARRGLANDAKVRLFNARRNTSGLVLKSQRRGARGHRPWCPASGPEAEGCFAGTVNNSLAPIG